MTQQESPLAPRRAAIRPQWGGLSPDALFARLEEEPRAGDALCALGDALLETAAGRLLEFVALRTSAARTCLYMWRGHCRIALQRAPEPLSREDVARVAAGAATLSGDDAIVVAAIDELLGERRLRPSTRESLGRRALVLTIAVLFYETVAIVMRDEEPEAEPIEGLETPAIAARSVRR
jgi:Carboxymuconolactone decarboxylase family